MWKRYQESEKVSFFFFPLDFFLVYFKVLLHKLNKTLKSFSELPRGLNNSVRNVFMNVEAEENLKIHDSMLNASGYLLLLCLSLHFTVHDVLGAIVNI